MFNDRHNGLTLDEVAEKAGGYVIQPKKSDVKYDFRAMSEYARKKGVMPKDLTADEEKMFLHGNALVYN